MTLPDEQLWAARRERARRWILAGGDLRGYPALSAEDETETTLATAPTKQIQTKSKAQEAPRDA